MTLLNRLHDVFGTPSVHLEDYYRGPGMVSHVEIDHKLEGEDLRGFHFQGTVWTKKRGQFCNCNLSGSDFRESQITRERSYEDRGVTERQIPFILCDLSDTHWGESQIHSIQFEDCIFTGANFTNADIYDCKFVRCRFVDTVFERTRTTNNQFLHCVFENVDIGISLGGWSLGTCELENVNCLGLNSVSLRGVPVAQRGRNKDHVLAVMETKGISYHMFPEFKGSFQEALAYTEGDPVKREYVLEVTDELNLELRRGLGV